MNKNLEVEAELNVNENIEPEINENIDTNAMAGDGNAQEHMRHAIETLQQELECMQDGDRDHQTGSDTPLFHGCSNEDFQTVQETYNIARQFEFLLHAATPAPVSANQTTVPKLLYHSQNQSQDQSPSIQRSHTNHIDQQLGTIQTELSDIKRMTQMVANAQKVESNQ